MKVVTTAIAVAGLAVTVAACASSTGGATTPSTSSSAASPPRVADPSVTSAASSPSASPTPSGGATSAGRQRILVSIGDERFEMTLDDSPASRDLVGQLPVTLEMQDHGSVEKTGRLPRPLSLEGQPDGADPDPGDVGYYAPGNDLVLYYGDQSFFPGIVVLGRMDARAAARIGEMRGSITATVNVAP